MGGWEEERGEAEHCREVKVGLGGRGREARATGGAGEGGEEWRELFGSDGVFGEGRSVEGGGGEEGEVEGDGDCGVSFRAMDEGHVDSVHRVWIFMSGSPCLGRVAFDTPTIQDRLLKPICYISGEFNTFSVPTTMEG